MVQDMTAQAIDERVQRFYGKYRGIVRDNQDPKNLGRIRARVPDVLGDLDTGWALPCAPYAGDGTGLFSIPPNGAGVWIEFEAGDPSCPVWSGCWWGENQLPKDEGGTAATPPIKIIRSERGLMVCMDDNGQTIVVSDENGSNLLKIQVTQGQVKVQGAVKVVVEAPRIELVENPTHPLVFGDRLLQYLNQLCLTYATHTHPGEMVLNVLPVTPAPPVPPFPPATPSLISTRVWTE